MKKKAVFIYHLFITFSSIIFGVWSFIEASVLSNGEYEGWDGLGAGIGAAVLIIFGALLSVFAIISIIPTVVSLMAIKSDKKRHVITSIVFESLFLILFIAITVSLITETVALIFVPFVLLDTGAIILNTLILRDDI